MASRQAAQHLVEALADFLPATVAVFHALPEEIDAGPLIACLRARSCNIALPRQIRPGEALALHLTEPDTELRPGPFGVHEPLPDAAAAHPKIIIVPLLGYDFKGNRLGYGAGFYDRTLAHWRKVEPNLKAIGYGYALQWMDQLPVGAADETLDGVCTEQGFTWIR
ncbi:5-formyltetrahydrofolate cyclo-ligase [Arboricoccus pini]|uniref:5-formyltetrahydrofolate cyclo-ligase n=2 Tax=Arboricoccus pini TaxID=1963835 RepID=A0A212PX59_9PROT|nr:5-formyltetrahydrofolate cyclo-ligase [Arboricoccus pini]